MENEPLSGILEHFAIAERAYRLEALEQGFINDTFLVFDEESAVYILQRVNTAVFTRVEAIMNNIRHALEYLNDEDYQAINLVPSKSGKPFFKHEGGCWRLMTFIKDSIAYNNTTDKEIAFEAGKILGRFHCLLANAPVDKFEDIISGFHSLSLREDQFRNALKQAEPRTIERAGEAIFFAEQTLSKLKDWDTEGLPLRICHNDTKLNNFLFSKTTGKALCLIDLDTLMKGYFHYDFGDAVRTVANTAPEDEKDHRKITFDKGLFEAFLNGLATNGTFLTQKEKEVLPYGAVLMPFLHGIRALTDFLSGNKYYKVAYPDQNLDRSLSLFNFVEKAWAEIPFMEELLSKMDL